MNSLFGLLGLLVMPFWLMMIFAPRWRFTERAIRSAAIFVAPACAYVFLVIPQIAHVLPIVANPKLPEVAALLGAPNGAIVAWVHFLAFDLFVGRWIYLEAMERRISPWIVSPILALTLLLGPMGFLAFLIIRGVAGFRAQSSRQSTDNGMSNPGPRTLIQTARQILAGNPALAFTFWFNVGLVAVSLAGLAVDHRVITGMPAWMKPLKFGVSTAMYAFTLSWLLTYVTRRERFRSGASWVSATMLTYEVSVIAMQAARGTTSHFNHTTLLDTVLFATMGIGIIVVAIVQAAVVAMLIRQPLQDKPLALALRLGAAITLLGMLAAIPMVIPRADQLARLHAMHGLPYTGSHTIGAADGGPGMPVTGWSASHGDLRIAHFWGLHALQILPLLGLLLSTKAIRLSATAKTRLVSVAGTAYAAVMAILFAQARIGESAEHPSTTIIYLSVLTIITNVIGIAAIWIRDVRHGPLRPQS